ncbi:MAG: cation transporter [Clostridiales bacterium]|nr:cation transporter [Clostridiales bacterium]
MRKLLIKLFIKDPQNTSDPKVREKYGKLAGVVGIVSNMLLCIMKIVIGIFSRSIAIIADGVNNLADASSSIITLLSFKLSSLPEDKDHPYGHARIEYISGLIISLIIIIIGLQLLKTSFLKVMNPEALNFSYITIIMLLVAIAVKLWQALFNKSIGKTINSLTLTATATDSRNDCISTAAVLLSLLIGKATGINIDGYMGCLVALFIIWSGIMLVKETTSPLLGEAPDEDLVNDINQIVRKSSGVLGVHDLIVHNYGPGKVFASIHIEVDADGDLMKSHDMIDNIEHIVKESLHIEFVAHMDPIKTNDPLIKELRAIISQTLVSLDGVESIHDFRIVPGPTHTNIIFDTVLSADCKLAENEILKIADDALKAIDENYFVVITFDRAYTSL